ncbi:MAG: MFS transporter [Planctomycetota bacterium]|nr:MAG: MFS transporter [Planctomycetota bacterium]
MPGTPPERVLARDLAASTLDGGFYSGMVGLCETYLAAFVLALGHSEQAAGLVAGVPILAGAALQLATPAGVRWLGSQRRWVVLCAVVQAASFTPLLLGALLQRMPVALIFLCVALYWASGMATAPAWNGWISTLVPPRIRPRYFAARARVCQASQLCGILAGGVLLQLGAARGRPLLAFAGLFGLAGAARWTSSRFLARQSEPVPIPKDMRSVGLLELLRRFRHQSDGRQIAFMLAMQVAIQLASPYYHPYILRQVGFTYGEFTAVQVAGFLAKILAVVPLGRYARRHGARSLLWIGALGLIPIGPLWTASDGFAYLVGVQCLAGVAYAAYELGTFLLFFDTIRMQERTSVLTLYNLAHATSCFVGAAAGGLLLNALGDARSAYYGLFWTSAALRLFTLPLLARMATSDGRRGVPV